MKLLVAVFLFCVAVGAIDITREEAKAGPIDVFIVPHTHDDVGWYFSSSHYAIVTLIQG
jgi:hypothetical protein